LLYEGVRGLFEEIGNCYMKKLDKIKEWLNLLNKEASGLLFKEVNYYLKE